MRASLPIDAKPSRGEAGDGSEITSFEAKEIAPTRRRLLALMATLATAVGGLGGWVRVAPASPTPPAQCSTSDPIPGLFAAFQTLLASHEATLSKADRLEAGLVAQIGYPRVRLPAVPGSPLRYAADSATIAEHLPPGPRRKRLVGALQRRQRLWAGAAAEVGLTPALAHEAALAEDLLAAVSTLLVTPAPTVLGIMLKLVVLLSWQAPGTAFQDTTPWRELRVILADLDALAGTD